MSDSHTQGGHARTWLSTVPVLLLMLSYLLVLGTLEQLRSRLLAFGSHLAPGYTELRTYPVCTPCPEMPVAATAQPAVAKPAAKPAKAAGDDDDAFDEPVGQPSAAAEQAAHNACVAQQHTCQGLLGQVTPRVKLYRAIETRLSQLVDRANAVRSYFLVLLLLIGAASATAFRAHIGLRPVKSLLDDRFSEGMQLIAHGLLFASWYAEYQLQREPLPLVWMIGLAVMALFNVVHLLRPAKHLTPTGSWFHASLTAPLYATMALISGLFFLVVERYPSGLATYLQPLTEHSLLYFQVGLYGWAGMLLVRTRVVGLFFDVLRPWQLPSELLVFVVIAFCAFPTAYTGASGIFVIASGAAIFEELRRSGVRQKLALAGTAMSGSLGVVLSPCLLVMIIGELNKEVTPDQIYSWGWKVYAFSAVMFLIAMLISKREPIKLAQPAEAAAASLRSFRPMVPFAVLSVAVIGFYAIPLGTKLDEHSAPSILPVLLLCLLVWDRFIIRREAKQATVATLPGGTFSQIKIATGETAIHIGALLMLMGLSACIGGVVERSRVMGVVPTSFSSPLIAMLVLVVVLVITGMLMDPYGAVILVSGSIAGIALRSGISPTHFWMVVLVAFELGYLLPPVALNQLLARKVIGPLPPEEGPPEKHFWRRHEDVLLPIAVMSTVLLVVAFGPLFWHG